MSIIEKIEYIYQNIMPKQSIMLNHDEAIEYFERLMIQGNIITYIKDGELLGFLEFWRLDYSQFGRVCCNWTLEHGEDLLEGEVALISRMWITPEDRNSEVFTILASMFISRNKDAKNFAAMQMHKKHKPLQIYSRDQILKHYK